MHYDRDEGKFFLTEKISNRTPPTAHPGPKIAYLPNMFIETKCVIVEDIFKWNIFLETPVNKGSTGPIIKFWDFSKFSKSYTPSKQQGQILNIGFEAKEVYICESHRKTKLSEFFENFQNFLKIKYNN